MQKFLSFETVFRTIFWLFVMNFAVPVQAASQVVWQLKPDNVVLENQCRPDPSGSLRFTGGKSGVRLVSRELIKIDPEAEYVFSFKVRSQTGKGRVNLTLICFDDKGAAFEPTAVVASEDYGVLSAPVKRGDKTVKVTGAEKWQRAKAGSVIVFNAKKDCSDLPNRSRSAAVKSISADGQIEFVQPLRRKYPAGTAVRRHWLQGGEDTLLPMAVGERFVAKSRSRKGISARGRESGKFIYGAAGFKVAVSSKCKDVEIGELSVTRILPRQKNKMVVSGTGARKELIAKAFSGEVKTARLSWWGFKEDATELLQNAIDSKISKLIIDNIGKPWVTDTIELRSDLEIVFEEGAAVEAKPDAFHSRTACHFVGNNVCNVIIRGEGRGGIIRMRKRDYQDAKRYVPSEYRHCVAFSGGRNIRVENMKLASSGGDGFIIRAYGQIAAENIVARKLHCDDNHRQGISVICGRNILIEDCILSNTDGAPPMAGIDIESNHEFEPASNIVVRNCRMINNTGLGLGVSITRMNTDIAGPVGVLVENCEMTDNFRGCVAVGVRARWPRDNVRMDGNVIFKNLKFINLKHKNRRRHPINIEIDNYDTLNISFDNIEVTRGPVANPAILIANCTPDGKVPGTKISFRNMKYNDVPADKIFSIYDHSFTGDPDWIKGLDYQPEKYRKITAFKGNAPVPAKFSGVRKYKDLFAVFRPDFWAYGNAGTQGEVTFEFRSMGYRSRKTTITMITPSCKKQIIGTMDPGEIRTFRIDFKESGYHKFEMRGFYELFALKSSTVPAGLYIAEHGTHFLQSTGNIFFTVPENSADFAVRAWGRSNILWCGVELFAPDGKKVWDTVTNHAQFTPSAALQKTSGVWKLHLKHPQRTFGKYHIALPGLPPYAALEIAE